MAVEWECAEVAARPDSAAAQVEDRDHMDRAERRAADGVLAVIDSLQAILENEAELDSPSRNDRLIPEHPAVWPVPRSSRERLVGDPCLVCGQTEFRVLYKIDGIAEQYVRCEDCGLGMLYPRPTLQRIAQFYPAEYYGAAGAKFESLVETAVRLGARMRVRSLLAEVPEGSRVLDVGCGRGVMLRGLLDQGFEAHGVEISASAAIGTDPRAQIRIAPRLQDANYDTHSFSAVILWHVFEHLSRPDQTLDEIARILKPGGRLIIAVPNAGSWQAKWAGPHWFHLDLPRHLYHFSDQTLVRLVERHGFATRSLRHFALLQNPFGWLQSLLNRFTDMPRNALYSSLHCRGAGGVPTGISAGQRAALRAAYWCGLPLAGLASLVEAACGRGGTIALVAEQPAKVTSRRVANRQLTLSLEPACH